MKGYMKAKRSLANDNHELIEVKYFENLNIDGINTGNQLYDFSLSFLFFSFCCH